LILPLPLHPERLRERGFNQSMEIARALGNCLNLAVDRSSLVRNRATPPQADLPLKERHRNVRGAFECTADMTGKDILLIDDVMTSGATLNECARVLKLHGASSITAVVAARALKH
jgi:ComF family protein